MSTADKQSSSGKSPPSISANGDPGIIFVGSGITQPQRLTPAAFIAWYEDRHVQEVLATGGVSGAGRYARARNSSSSSSATTAQRTRWLSNAGDDGDGKSPQEKEDEDEEGDLYPWLTVYTMPSLAFRHTPRFKGLDGQSKPQSDVLERVFANARFATRFAALRFQRASGVVVGHDDAVEPAPFVVAATVGRISGGDVDSFGSRLWDKVSSKQSEDGVDEGIRVQVFQIEGSSVLDEFVRTVGKEGYIVLVQYFRNITQEARKQSESGEDEIVAVIRSALVAIGGEDLDVGAFKLRRAYGSGMSGE